MQFLLQPWQLYFLSLTGWINRQQQDVIAYLRAENQVLREKHGKKRLLVSDDQRRRLAVKGKVLGRKLLGEVGTLFTPDTILRCIARQRLGIVVRSSGVFHRPHFTSTVGVVQLMARRQVLEICSGRVRNT